ncbi:calcium-binding protein, partial [Candidatus Saccharibacteria bacterium]
KSKSSAGRQFKNCSEAFEAGVFDIRRSDPSYQNKLDRDNDGIACEK